MCPDGSTSLDTDKVEALKLRNVVDGEAEGRLQVDSPRLARVGWEEQAHLSTQDV